MLKIIWAVPSTLLLIYLFLPLPGGIDEFSDLPSSVKSTLPGDTYQIVNGKGFFSNNYRDYVTNYYRQNYQQLSQLPFPPIRLNYPPEMAFSWIKDQTQSTYLEEYVYPLRGSLFVNGFEPFLPDGTSRFRGAVEFGYNHQQFQTKVTLRYYPSALASRLIAWLGINLAVYLIYQLARRMING